ncbi:MAG: hypothetical protein ACI8PB_000278 [Desulforhopalus sp.]
MAEKKKPALRSTPSIKKAPSLDQFAAAAGTRKNDTDEVYPWEDPRVREDVKKNLPLRLPEALYMKLKYIADHTPYSMNSFILEKLTEEIEGEITSLLS